MADIVLTQGAQLPNATKTRYKDIGDGTHALMSAVLISGTDSNNNVLIPHVNADTRGLVTLSHYEADVLRSNRFKASYLQAHGSELGNDASHDFLIKTVACAHLTFRITAGGNCDVLFYETTTTSNDGTALATISKNRVTAGTSTAVVYDAPTVTGVGTLLFSWFIPGGTRSALGGGTWSETVWILKTSTNYLVRVTNRSGANIQLAVSAGWSEH